MEKEFDIFVSYSRKDTEVVKKIVRGINTLGYTTWMDKQGIHVGEDFRLRIVDSIEKKCKLVLFFSSYNSNSSKWTAKEIAVAVDKNIPIFPIRLDHSEYNDAVKIELINLNYIEYLPNKNLSETKAILKESLEGILGKRNCQEFNNDVNRGLLTIAEKYRRGDGVDQDYKFACQLYQKAADQGNSTALCNLASMYFHGFGVSQNINTSFILYKLAADSGSPLALYKLGEFYFKGILGETNYNKAILLFQESAVKGCWQAQEKLTQIENERNNK